MDKILQIMWLILRLAVKAKRKLFHTNRRLKSQDEETSHDRERSNPTNQVETENKA